MEMKFLDEIKSLDPKKPGGWPWLVQLSAYGLIFLAVILLGALLDWQMQWQEYSGLKQQEDKLRETYLEKKQEAINLDIIKKQLLNTQQSFGALLKQLPSKSEMDALLTDINQAGLGRGLQFELFRPGVEVPTGVFTEQPISIKVSGSYDDLGNFASDISQLPRIVTLNDISIAPTGSSAAGSLSMVATAKTYRYLDENELASQKKPSKPSGGKK